MRIDDAEGDAARCMRENALGPAVLADACANAGIRLLTFSSDQVFDGSGDTALGRERRPGAAQRLRREQGGCRTRTCWHAAPTRWSFEPAPSSVPGIDTTSSLRRSRRFGRGEPFRAASDVRVSPTYLPDLVNVCLDLLIDGESGIWHLANRGDVSWAELAALAGRSRRHCRADAAPLRRGPLGQRAARPRNSVLGSERAALMPPLDDALRRFLAERTVEAPALRDDDARAFRPGQRAAGL